MSFAVNSTHVIREVCGEEELAPKRRSVVEGVLISQRNGPERSADAEAKLVLSLVSVRESTG